MRFHHFALCTAFLGVNALAQTPPAKARVAKHSGLLGSPKEEDALTDALPAAPKTVEADTALLRALLYVFEPAPHEIRILAIEDLALLGDARALNALGQLAMDPNSSIQAAAIRAIGQFQNPRAEELLANVVRHPRMAEPLKVQALNALVFQLTPTSRGFLEQVSRGGRFSSRLQTAAKRALAD